MLSVWTGADPRGREELGTAGPSYGSSSACHDDGRREAALCHLHSGRGKHVRPFSDHFVTILSCVNLVLPV